MVEGIVAQVVEVLAQGQVVSSVTHLDVELWGNKDCFLLIFVFPVHAAQCQAMTLPSRIGWFQFIMCSVFCSDYGEDNINNK